MNAARLVSIFCGTALLSGLVWGYGFLVGKGKAWPAETVDEAISVVESVIAFGSVIPENRRFAAPEGASRSHAVVHDETAAMGEGYYVMLGWDDESGHYVAWLRDAAGEFVHSWNVDQTSFHDASGSVSDSPHALQVMRNGDIIVGFDWVSVMTRLSPCSEPLWQQQDGFYHHAYQEAPDGNVWTWYSEGLPTGQYQYMIKFDPETGRTVKKIGLLEDIVTRSPQAAALFSLQEDTEFEPDGTKAQDIFHPNDVEELSPELAAAFPMFEAGDLLISLRNLDMVAVIDQEGTVKWMRQGPWRQQHDPDFQPDGTISVFNNARGPGRTRSDIVSIDPVTGESRSLFGDWDKPFYTGYRGSHQTLPNGNTLLVIPEQGQVLEVTPEGAVAVEFNNVSTPGSPFNDDVANAAWLPKGYFDEVPSCPRKPSTDPDRVAALR
jgi:hypothetical protein